MRIRTFAAAAAVAAAGLLTTAAVNAADTGAQEKEIAALESAIEAAASDYQELTRLLAEKESAEETLLAMMEEWEKAGEG